MGHVRMADGGLGRQDQTGSDDLQRWASVKAVFLESLDYPEDGRSAFVERACAGDPRLRAEVESLLASDEAAASFCETPAAALFASDDGPREDSASRLPDGTRLGAYEITGFIAAGGMGEVYRARHAILGREVAIKIVGGVRRDEAAGRRLLREARHAASLAHPNISTIHEVGEASGAPFIVMELVEGRSLREVLQAGILSLQDALAYGLQITDALEHAHQHGIIHRDLKSSNVVIDGTGRAIVLDFGLARRLPRRIDDHLPEPTLTSPGLMAGTLSHMAPEVLRGTSADVRSDVWALGVLLYELATGQLPFTGRTTFETTSAILGSPPRFARGRVPLALRLVIERCLIKDPDGRYQSARAVYDAVDAIRRKRAWPVVGRLLIRARRRTLYATTAAGLLVLSSVMGIDRLRAALPGDSAARISTLAILPLTDATGDRNAAVYAEGLTEALTSTLGQASNIRVLSRASTSRVVRTASTSAEIGTRLGADVLVEGTVRRADGHVAIDVRLVRPTDGHELWSHHYERGLRDVLALEADVVRGLADATRMTLMPAARERLAVVRAVDPAVYEEYLKGRYEWNHRTERSLQLAMAHFARAVELDPTYAPAHAALADCLNQLGTVMLGGGAPSTYRPRAEAEAISALQIDPSSAEAHAALGYAWHYEWRWADAEREFRRALALNPSYALAHIWYANLLMSRRRMPEAVAQVLAARGLDPFSLIVNTNVGWVLDMAGRHDDAIVQLTHTLALDSSYAQAHWRLADALMSAGRRTEALRQSERLVALSDSSLPALALLAKLNARAGRRDTARALLAVVLARGRTQYVPSASIAHVYAALGDVPNALAWLEKAFREQSNSIAYLAADPFDASLREDPRFVTLLVRAGLE